MEWTRFSRMISPKCFDDGQDVSILSGKDQTCNPTTGIRRLVEHVKAGEGKPSGAATQEEIQAKGALALLCNV